MRYDYVVPKKGRTEGSGTVPLLPRLSGLLRASVISSAFILASPQAAVTVQKATDQVTGTNAWSYLVLEAESFETQADNNPDAGFARVDKNSGITSFLGNPVLGPDSTASGGAALYTKTIFAEHADKVTYKVQFAKTGTYYLYMRFTMFENGGNVASYGNEDSFFVPPDFGKDPQTDWPLPRGGYAEGCCDVSGFLYIKDDPAGFRVNHNTETEETQKYWEGNFHWNQLISSQFDNPDTTGEPSVAFKYEVTADRLGKPLEFTISYREGGVTPDLFLFSTDSDLMSHYTQAQLDQLLVAPDASLAVQKPTDKVTSATNSWSYLILEGENFVSEADNDEDKGFARVDKTGSITSFLGNPILGPNSTASGTGALYTKTIFAEHADKVTYKVQFSQPGTYYLYMRFTMFENGGNVASYANEDSFFVPPDFGKDPQTDWPLPRGGYAEGCCDLAGFLYIKDDPAGFRVNHNTEDENTQKYWEGNFHYNQLISSQFDNPDTTGEPNVPFKYEVTADRVGKPLDFTISYREGGVTVDFFLFSTDSDLMSHYTQAQLDQFLLPPDTSLAVQKPTDKVTGTNAWSYLVLEGENFVSEADGDENKGFARVDKSGSITSFLGNPILGTNSTASGTGALYTKTIFAEHADKVTYHVQFATPGTYYLYMRFTMFENGGNVASYANEDSFFVPPDFGKDPQTDWPLPRGGYAEGCCDVSGFLYIKDDPTGFRVNHNTETEDTQKYWEGNFHWNQLISSQFNNPDTSGEPSVAFKYEVTADRVGKPLDFTISYREGGVTVDLFLFSTDPDLMSHYTQAQLDDIILAPASAGGQPSLSISRSGNNVVISWASSAAGYVLESTTALGKGNTWSAVSTGAVTVGEQNTVTVSSATGTAYYRLRKP
jgi:hypothetical protein